ncbi:MAG: hypothetical protein WA857_05085 [Candidatus Acidiferrum sp.]
MKALSLISTGALLLLLGAVAPTYAQEEKPQQEAKPQKQEEKAKPQKQEQAKPEKQEQAKPARQEKPAQAKPEKQQQARSTKQNQVQQSKSPQHKPAQGQWARNGQKDSQGHVYNASRFGRDHHARFEQNGGRFYQGRREYSYGGYWFYAGAYPPWFYQQQVYFVMGADGLWYAVAYGNPSLRFQVYIQ